MVVRSLKHQNANLKNPSKRMGVNFKYTDDTDKCNAFWQPCLDGKY